MRYLVCVLSEVEANPQPVADDLSPEYLTSILNAVNPLLAARNREVVKSVLGFVKLCVHSLPTEVVQSQLEDIVRGLIGCLTTHRVLKVRVSLEYLLGCLLGCIS